MMTHSSPKHHIELKTREALPKGMAGRWARAVIKNGPEGIAVATEMLRGRELVNTRLYCVRGATGCHYVVPLARDLSDAEAERIARAWSDAYPDGDFVVNWSQDDGMEVEVRRVQDSMLEQIADTAAKHSHNRWYEGMVGDRWQWGPKMSRRNRMHPMLRPWDDLPEKYRSRERDRFITLLGVLEALDLRITRE